MNYYENKFKWYNKKESDMTLDVERDNLKADKLMMRILKNKLKKKPFEIKVGDLLKPQFEGVGDIDGKPYEFYFDFTDGAVEDEGVSVDIHRAWIRDNDAAFDGHKSKWFDDVFTAIQYVGKLFNVELEDEIMTDHYVNTIEWTIKEVK